MDSGRLARPSRSLQHRAIALVAVSLFTFQLSEIAVQPEKSTRFRLNRQAPIAPHQNPGHRVLDPLPHFPA